MCQLPLINMWVRRMRPPEKRITSHLPSETTLSKIRPASGVSSSTRASFGRTVSNRVTARPPMARCSVRAARQMVSPSGTLFVALRPAFCDLGYWHDTTHLKAHGSSDEPRFLEKARQKVCGRGLAFDLPDQQTRTAALPADCDLGQFL